MLATRAVSASEVGKGLLPKLANGVADTNAWSKLERSLLR